MIAQRSDRGLDLRPQVQKWQLRLRLASQPHRRLGRAHRGQAPTLRRYAVGDTVTVTVTLGAIDAEPQITGDPHGREPPRGEPPRTPRHPCLVCGGAHRRLRTGSTRGPSSQVAAGRPTASSPTYASTAYGTTTASPSSRTARSPPTTRRRSSPSRRTRPGGSASACQMDTCLEMSARLFGSWTSGWDPQDARTTFAVDPASGMPAALCSLGLDDGDGKPWFVGTGNERRKHLGPRHGDPLLAGGAARRQLRGLPLGRGQVRPGGTTTTATTWTTPTHLYPTDTQIASMPQGYSGNPFTTYGSKRPARQPERPLPEDGGQCADKDTDYRFKVVPRRRRQPSRSPSIDDCASCA